MRTVKKEVTYEVTRPCSSCHGSGRQTCMRCSGSGIVYVPIYGSDQQCPNCGGSGVCDCYTCCGKGTQVTYETRWEDEWVNDPNDFQSSSYTSYTSTASSPSSYRSRRSGSRMGRYVVFGIIGAVLGSYVGQVWLGIFLAIVIAACTKRKKKW